MGPRKLTAEENWDREEALIDRLVQENALHWSDAMNKKARISRKRFGKKFYESHGITKR
jgi:hypothetical protein